MYKQITVFLILIAAAVNALADEAALKVGWRYTAIGDNSETKIEYQDRTVVMEAEGIGYGGRSDSLGFQYQHLAGDFTITARVTVERPTDSLFAGIMLRESLKPDARSVFLFLNGTNRTEMKSRRFKNGIVIRDRWFGTVGEGKTHWLRLVRLGDQISLYDSEDGKGWSMGFRHSIGEGMTLPELPQQVFVGLAASSGNAEKTAIVRFDNIEVTLPHSPNRTTWFGNSGPTPKSRVNMSARVTCIDPVSDTVYVGGPDEWTGLVAYRGSDGRVINSSRLKPTALAHDGRHLYIALRNKRTDQYGLRRYAWESNGRDLSRLMSIHINDGGLDVLVNTDGPCQGAAVDPTRQEIYVSDTPNDRIVVYSTEEWPQNDGDVPATPIREFPVDAPGDLALDPKGALWVVKRGDDSARIARYSPEGELQVVVSENVGNPRGITVDAEGRLLIADAGADCQMKIFAECNGTMRLAGTLGKKGGIHSGIPGRVAPDKLNHPQDVAVDSKGNIIVCAELTGIGNKHLGTGGEIRKFSRTGNLLWECYGLEFVDTGDFDPADPTIIYTKQAQYKIDYNAPTGKDWRYTAMTVDPRTYPDDIRLYFGNGGGVYVRRIEGQRLLYVFDQGSSLMGVYRFEPGSEVAIPAAVFSTKTRIRGNWPADAPDNCIWMWIDRNGDGAMQADEFAIDGPKINHFTGWHVDTNGGVWVVSSDGALLYHAPPTLDRNGVPVYKIATRYRVNEMFTSGRGSQARKLCYDAKNDRLYIMGFTSEHSKPQFSHFGASGSEVVRFDNFLAADGNVQASARYLLPILPPQKKVAHGGNEYRMRGLTVCGPSLFVLSNWASVHVYEIATGKEAAVLRPGPEVGGWCGLVDCDPGFNVTYYDGAYRVIMEDDIHIKQLIYHWIPPEQLKPKQ